LAPGELIVAVRLPAEAAAFSRNTRYLKLRERTSYAFAVVSAAAALEIEGDSIRRARIALGGVAPKPWRAREAEASLEGKQSTAKAFAKAAELALAQARPSGNNAFKIELARRIVMRALSLASEGTPEVMPALPASPFCTITGANHGA
jgi:xanthine dehydrogenase YagS FAD-binding subunit